MKITSFVHFHSFFFRISHSLLFFLPLVRIWMKKLYWKFKIKWLLSNWGFCYYHFVKSKEIKKRNWLRPLTTSLFTCCARHCWWRLHKLCWNFKDLLITLETLHCWFRNNPKSSKCKHARAPFVCLCIQAVPKLTKLLFWKSTWDKSK